MNFFFHAPAFFISCSVVISWRSFYAGWPHHLRAFSAVWTCWCVLDIVGHLLSGQGNNAWLYNLLYLIYFPGIAYCYLLVLDEAMIRKMIVGFLFVFPVFVIINSFFGQGMKGLQTLTYTLGGSFTIFLTAAYFRQLYQSDSNASITGDPYFWFSSGLLLCYAANTPFLGMLNYLWKQEPIFTRKYYYYVFNTFYILLSILTTAGFLCRKNLQKSY